MSLSVYSIAMGKKRDTGLSGGVTLTVRKEFLMTTTVSTCEMAWEKLSSPSLERCNRS